MFAYGGGGGGGERGPNVEALNGGWFGVIEDGGGSMATLSVTLLDGRITSSSVNGVTGTAVLETKNIFSFELSQGAVEFFCQGI